MRLFDIKKQRTGNRIIAGRDGFKGRRYAVNKRPLYFIRVYPPVDTETDLLIKYKCVPTELSSGSDIPLIPSQFHYVLAALAKYNLAVDDGVDPRLLTRIGDKAYSAMSNLLGEQTKAGVRHRVRRRGLTRHGKGRGRQNPRRNMRHCTAGWGLFSISSQGACMPISAYVTEISPST